MKDPVEKNFEEFLKWFFDCADQTKIISAAHDWGYNHGLKAGIEKANKAPREWWINIYPDTLGNIYESKEQAEAHLATRFGSETILVREVLPVEKK